MRRSAWATGSAQRREWAADQTPTCGPRGRYSPLVLRRAPAVYTRQHRRSDQDRASSGCGEVRAASKLYLDEDFARSGANPFHEAEVGEAVAAVVHVVVLRGKAHWLLQVVAGDVGATVPTGVICDAVLL